jgi:hypothetical protein
VIQENERSDHSPFRERQRPPDHQTGSKLGFAGVDDGFEHGGGHVPRYLRQGDTIHIRAAAYTGHSMVAGIAARKTASTLTRTFEEGGVAVRQKTAANAAPCLSPRH